MVLQIPVTGERAIDGAAMFLCILAYPYDEKKRQETFWATIAYRIRQRREYNKIVGRPVRGEVPDPRAQSLLAHWPVCRMWGVLDALNKQLMDRLRYAELLNYFGRVAFAKPVRTSRPLPVPQRVTFTENGTRIDYDSTLSRFPTSSSDLVKIGAQRYNMEPGNVRKNIVTPGKTVAHLAIALREIVLSRNASRKARTGDAQTDDDLLTYLLSCPQLVRGALEDAEEISRTWSANAAVFPSWQSVDPSQFIELQLQRPVDSKLSDFGTCNLPSS